MKGNRAAAFEIALFLFGAFLWGISSFYNYKTLPSAAMAKASTRANAAAPEMAPYTESLPGSKVKFDMVPIPGGTFMMGSPATEAHRSSDEGPQHPVKIRPFWMGKTEVTWNGYDRFAFALGIKKSAGESPTQESADEKMADAITRPTPPYADPTFGFGHDGYPAISMTHHAAMEYTRWLSAQTGKIYRLPTEAEWEYACRAGAKTSFSFGDDTGELGDEAWFDRNSDAHPHPVGKKKPNPWGLYDINGNVAEWVLDLYDKNYYHSFDPLIPAESPVRLPTESEYPYVVRGGSWADDAGSLRCAARRASTEDWSKQDPQLPQSIWWHTDATFVGFRVVRPLQEQENLKGLKSKVKKLD
ncbi:MAG TPA: formylglycine-generating enzyme family protein [Terriglobia bacterium]|nr:formylglycine-generating enzyme family protein [Terriglobia bacterium]